MLKKLMILTLIGILTLPLSISASSVPQDVEENLQQNLSTWIPSLQRLTNDQAETNKQGLAAKNEAEDHLGEGYAVYDIDLRNSVTKDTYPLSPEDMLRFKGYMFTVEGQNGSKALAFAYSPPNYTEITRISSSEEFSDADFKIPMEKAKKLVGFNTTSKLLYDLAHQTIALVTTTDKGQQVALLEDSMLLGLKKYDVLSLTELIDKVRNIESEQAQNASINNEPTSGGGGGSATGNGGAGNLQNAANSSAISPYIWSVSVIVLIGIGVLTYVIYRKRKKYSLQNHM